MSETALLQPPKSELIKRINNFIKKDFTFDKVTASEQHCRYFIYGFIDRLGKPVSVKVTMDMGNHLPTYWQLCEDVPIVYKQAGPIFLSDVVRVGDPRYINSNFYYINY